MKKLKLFIIPLAIAILICALSSCSKFEYDNSTVVAKVIAINGNKVTLSIGEMNFDENMIPSMGDMSMPEGQVPEIPGGMMPGGEGMPDMGEMTFPEGESMSGMDIPMMPDGESMPEMGDMQIPGGESVPEGQMPDMQGGAMQRPDGMQGGMADQFFTDSGDSVILTLNDDVISTLTVDCIVMITFGEKGSVESLTVLGGDMQGEIMTPPEESGEVIIPLNPSENPGA